MANFNRLRPIDMLERAARGVGKVDLHGPRGVANISHNEIEAMSMVLSIMNFPQIAPGNEMTEAELLAFFADKLKDMRGFAVLAEEAA